MGMCPRHARRLIDQIGGGRIMTTVLREALAGAQGCLAGTVSPAICPPCEVAATAREGATHVIVSALGDPRLRQIYGEHVGICVPHLVQAARWTEPGNLRLLAEQLHDVLADHDHRASVELLAGRDPDAPRRRRWRDELPARPTTGPIADEVCARLDLEACPACTANGWGDERYLDWFAQRTHAGDPSIDDDPGELCSVHLHDAALADEAAAGHAIQHKRRARRTELRRLLEGLAQAPGPRRGRRARADEIGRPTAQFITRAVLSRLSRTRGDRTQPAGADRSRGDARAGARALQAAARSMRPPRPPARRSRSAGCFAPTRRLVWRCSPGRSTRPRASTPGLADMSRADPNKIPGHGRSPSLTGECSRARRRRARKHSD